MSQYKTEPEYILAESVKTLHTEKQLDSFVQDLLVDMVVLRNSLTKLADFSGRIVDDIKVLGLSVSVQEPQEH